MLRLDGTNALMEKVLADEFRQAVEDFGKFEKIIEPGYEDMEKPVTQKDQINHLKLFWLEAS